MERPRSNKYLISATAVLAVTLGAIFGTRECTDEQSKPKPSTSTTPINPGLTRSEEINQLLATSSEIQKQILLQNYLSTSDEFQRIFSRQITFDQRRLGSLNPEVINNINQQAIEHVADGANLAKLLLPPEEAVKIHLDGTRRQLTIDDLELNLNNNLQFHLAASLIRLKIEELLAPDKINPHLVRNEVENLQWLAKTNPPIVIESGSFAILPKKTLVMTARLLRSFQEAKIPAPRETYFKNWQPGDSGGAWYEHRDYPHPFRITVTNASDEKGLVHEAGHHVSGVWVLDPNNTQLVSFSQESFAALIGTLRQKLDAKPLSKKDMEEEYANAFNQYFLQGDAFRRSLTQSDPTDHQTIINKQEYRFMNSVFGGRHFSNEGLALDTLVKEVPIQIGDILRIVDPDVETPGILLRQKPTLTINPDLPVVWDSNYVQVIDGPIAASDPQGRKVEMWKVRLGFYISEGTYLYPDTQKRIKFIPYGKNVEGWISKEWLGRIIQN